MIYPIEIPVRLPDKFSDLLQLAVKDYKKILKDSENYIVDMTRWHSPYRNSTKCSVLYGRSCNS